MASQLFGNRRPQRGHLVNRPSKGVPGEVNVLRADVEASFEALESGGGLIVTDIFTDPAAADPNGIKTSFATANTAQAFTAEDSDFDGAEAAQEMVPPRTLSITSTANAHVTAVDVVIRGRLRLADGSLVAVEDTISLTGGGGATDVSATPVPFSFVDEVDIPAQGGAAGSLEIGTTTTMGCSRRALSRAGLLVPVQQIAIGVVVTTGTFVNNAASPVTLYTPAGAPNGSNDYAVTYVAGPPL